MATFTKEKKIEIVCEQMMGVPVADILAKYNLPESTFFYWKSLFFEKPIEDSHEERMAADSIKPRVVLMGANKAYFLRDCYVRGWSDSKMLKNIIDLHYTIMANRPEMQGKEMTELKKMLTEIVKFK